jgi:hypothetical protein
VDVDDDGECTPKEDAVLSKRRNEVAMASLIMKLGGKGRKVLKVF